MGLQRHDNLRCASIIPAKHGRPERLSDDLAPPHWHRLRARRANLKLGVSIPVRGGNAHQRRRRLPAAYASTTSKPLPMRRRGRTPRPCLGARLVDPRAGPLRHTHSTTQGRAEPRIRHARDLAGDTASALARPVRHRCARRRAPRHHSSSQNDQAGWPTVIRYIMTINCGHMREANGYPRGSF